MGSVSAAPRTKKAASKSERCLISISVLADTPAAAKLCRSPKSGGLGACLTAAKTKQSKRF